MKRGLLQTAAVVRAMALCASMVATACSGAGTSGEPTSGGSGGGAGAGAEDPGSLGKVSAQLTLPGGEQIQVITWQLTGPNGASTVVQSGSVPVAASNTVSFVVGGIPAGSGYTLSATGTSTDGSVVCSGSATFAIQPRATTSVPLLIGCNPATGGSRVSLVTGQFFYCATINGLTAAPLETQVGGTIALSALASAPIAANLTYAWSSPSGSFDQPSAPSANFTCTAAGQVAITLTVADGPVPTGSACSPALSTRTITVQCDPAPADAGPG
jgi:hypothetical protein